MNDFNLDGLNNIKADKELIDTTVLKVIKNTKGKTYFSIKKPALAAASLALIVGTTSIYILNTNRDLGKAVDNKTTVNKKIDNTDSALKSSKFAVADNSSSYVKPVTESNSDVSKSSIDTKDDAAVTKVINNDTTDKPKENSNRGAAEINVTDTAVPAPNNITTNGTVEDNNGISIPPIILKSSNGTQAKMLPLVVYKGKIYTESSTKVDSKDIKSFLGERIGKTENNIDEWNVEEKSSQELASNIGEQDIYTVKGYDDSFRIMSYSENSGQVYVQFFDCLNGIIVKSGKDIFGKLNLVDNIQSAKFRSFDDWNNGIDKFTDYNNLNLINEAVTAFNTAVPYDSETVGNDIDNSRNNNEYREITLKLKDGSEVKFTAFKKGYVSYGYSNIYFKVDNSVIDKLWQ